MVKDIPDVIKSTIMAWGGSNGGGIQYELPMSIQQLLNEGYLNKIER